MSEAPAPTTSQLTDNPQAPPSPSFVDRFLQSFFHEKNIKWMLVTGAAIVFGSSLMLVTKNWTHWPETAKFLTILAYTGAVYGAAEVCRLRLNLHATYKVLHSLTLLLLPVCFLSLKWLSSSVGGQTWNVVELFGLLVTACVFLWFTSSRILDHLLRGRQTTFLIAYCILCVAGALPGIHLSAPEFNGPDPAHLQDTITSQSLAAFGLTAFYWLVMTAGVMKVNRHTFWLAEEHRLPRVFGFLPVGMLGLQFTVLVATQAITAINLEWIGFALVMVAGTILMTTRTIADVFRQRTGDLVRPLPWEIVLPTFTGLVVAALGLTFSFDGFSYVHETSYAVIPTAMVVSGLMLVAAKDTRHAGFVWAGLICATIAYQCSPVLFTDIVNTLKQTTAEAIKRDRVPLSMYGVTYLPLLISLAGVSYWFGRRNELQLGRPVKHFVTVVTCVLFVFAMGDVASRFYISVVNIGTFLLFAVVFRDRRYAVPAIAALVMSAAFAIPAWNDRGHEIPADWIVTILSALAVVMIATQLPDRILNTIPAPDLATLRHRNSRTDRLSEWSLVLQKADGTNRNLVQIMGCFVAALTAIWWMGHAVVNFTDPWTLPTLLPFVLLMTAFTVYTLQHPRYLSGIAFWLLGGFAAARWYLSLPLLSILDILNAVCVVMVAGTVVSYAWLRLTHQLSAIQGTAALRSQLGLSTWTSDSPAICVIRDWRLTTAAFALPLADCCGAFLTFVVVPVQLLLLAATHFGLIIHLSWAQQLLNLWAPATVACVGLYAAVDRSRVAVVIATFAIPICVTGTLLVTGVPLSLSWCVVIWTAGHFVMGLMARDSVQTVHRNCEDRGDDSKLWGTALQVSHICLQGLLLVTCGWFDLPLRLAAVISLVWLWILDESQVDASRRTWFAINGNLQLLALAAGLAGCQGFVLTFFAVTTTPLALSTVMAATGISILLFDRWSHTVGPPADDAVVARPAPERTAVSRRLDPGVCLGWSGILRSAFVVMLVMLFRQTTPDVAAVVLAMAAFVLFAIAEFGHALRFQKESHVWSGCGVLAVGVFYLVHTGIITLGVGISQFVMLAISVFALTVKWRADSDTRLAIFRRPAAVTGHTLPAVVAAMAIGRELIDAIQSVSALNAMALMFAAAIYFQQAMVTRERCFAAMAALIANAGLMLTWRSLNWTDLEFYLVPVGLSILGFVELLKKDLPARSHDPLRYVGALTILVSPLFDVLDGSWGHMLTLMVLSVVVILTAIGLRIRVLVYTGSAFLLADLAAMVFHTTVAHPGLLWIFGLVLGAAVIGLAAVCENHREKLLSQIRFLTAELASWN